MPLAGKVAIVTGAGGVGCGRAIARRLARAGAAVVCGDVQEAGGRETVRLIAGQGGRATFLRADMRRQTEIRALVECAEHTYGGVDLLINNASAPYEPQGLLAGWFDAVEVDLLGPMHAILHVLPAMRRRGGGAVVNIGSTSALGHGHKPSKSPGYDVAKAGIVRLTTMLEPLAAAENIRVNCLVPDWVATPEVKAYWDTLSPQQRKEQGVPDVLTSLDEVADAVLRLATDERLAGRILVGWCGQPPRLIRWGDPGHDGWE
jgi:NAD(P)-dependent dehydrogenase (short-subunit alcohol dehydrogenase family)